MLITAILSVRLRGTSDLPFLCIYIESLELHLELSRLFNSSHCKAYIFYTQKGKEALFLFLSRTGIATRKWLIIAGSIEGSNSY
jgi:hypothetical protein